MPDSYETLDIHAPVPPELREVFKRYQKFKGNALDHDPGILNLRNGVSAFEEELVQDAASCWSQLTLKEVFAQFMLPQSFTAENLLTAKVYECIEIPGLIIVPNLLPQEIQIALLSRLLHRDLSDSRHKNNVLFHHDIPYPPASTSFFAMKSSPTTNLQPHDSRTHQEMSLDTFLGKKLRWITLGGQYDWTTKKYPPLEPVPFPADLAGLIEGLFPQMKAEAAIVNVYSPGDTLSLHRDISEDCHRPLASISLGCDALFLVGLPASESRDGKSEKVKHVTVRLGSGDVVLMSGASRYAWHGVPQIISDSCPPFLRSWPAEVGARTGQFESRRDWMAGKRVNLNVRQMFD